MLICPILDSESGLAFDPSGFALNFDLSAVPYSDFDNALDYNFSSTHSPELDSQFCSPARLQVQFHYRSRELLDPEAFPRGYRISCGVRFEGRLSAITGVPNETSVNEGSSRAAARSRAGEPADAGAFQRSRRG
ncbi:hypothetical protein EVAR_49145_1 [Eumeta japonica]|uniref:Uncharacterized protein n=1 Tax=Eumeta variegata TaxID=151549 RepID=A0A4C1Z8D1_EUMVA|nr:hypothetical protein EVAR_49145_1 [Eumeta japonica]